MPALKRKNDPGQLDLPLPTPSAAGVPGGQFIVLGPDRIAVRVRRSPRARYMSIRLDARDEHAILVLPRRVSLAEGKRFAEGRIDWLAERLAERPPRVRFVEGAAVPVLGIPHKLGRIAGLRGRVRRVDGAILVPAAEANFARRVEAWYRREARREITDRAQAAAARIGRRIGRIVVGDPKTQWGSCSAAGSLSFSWRLLMAPENVLDYVIAHEVAHLKEMNHGPRFWALVEGLCSEVEPARRWLGDNAFTLHRYG